MFPSGFQHLIRACDTKKQTRKPALNPEKKIHEAIWAA